LTKGKREKKSHKIEKRTKKRGKNYIKLKNGEKREKSHEIEKKKINKIVDKIK